jgi:hypothetical protein
MPVAVEKRRHHALREREGLYAFLVDGSELLGTDSSLLDREVRITLVPDHGLTEVHGDPDARTSRHWPADRPEPCGP